MKIDEGALSAHSRTYLVSPTSTPIGQLPHTTDSSIFHEFTCRAVAALRLRRMFRDFVSTLSGCSLPHSSQSPSAPVSGADRLLSRLAQRGSHRVACSEVGVTPPASRWPAPGCALTTIRLHQRTTRSTEFIMRLPTGATERYGASFTSTVYVGDGVWDARASRSVGIPFIGIGTGSRATRLFAEGAVCVFPDFSDADTFLKSVYEITNAA